MTCSNAKNSTGVCITSTVRCRCILTIDWIKTAGSLVLDDSIKQRRGRKMEGVSCHFDPVTNRFVKGQQVLTLGLASEESFLPLDSQVLVSNSQTQQLNRPYKDARSFTADQTVDVRVKPSRPLSLFIPMNSNYPPSLMVPSEDRGWNSRMIYVSSR